MFVFLSKFLPPFIYPLGIAILLLAGVLLFFRKRPRWRTGFEVAVLAILLLASNRWISYSLARSLEWRYLPMAEIPRAEVIVLLGGATEPSQPPRPQVEITGAGDRILYTGVLYQQGKAPVILASGGNIMWLENRPVSQAADMASALAFMGVPSEAVWLEEKSQNTFENALYCAEILKKHKINRIILVTSAMHMPRSVALFRKRGIDVIPAPTDYTVTQAGWNELVSSPSAFLVNLTPNAGSLALTTNVLKEYIGLFVYALRGWL